MSTQLKAGVIGLGILGQQHADFLYNHPSVTVMAVSDLRQSVVAQVAVAIGAEAFTDYTEMLQRHELDLVVVATPDHLHRAPTIAALEAGVPYLLQEKPLATSMVDAEAIYDVVERTKARLFVNFANRGSTLDLATRYTIQNGLLGRVVYGEARLDDNITVPTQMWGERTHEWATGSSTAHFLLSHVVDLLRWYFAPAEVTEVYAISQQEVLGYTPDLYDAYLTFTTGLKVRVKAEWIRYMDELVEFYLSFSGDEGTLIYNKRPGFGAQEGWRANLSRRVDTPALLNHRNALLAQGVNLAARIHQPMPTTGQLSAGGDQMALALERLGPSHGGVLALNQAFIDSILEETLEPTSWQGRGPLPTHLDGLRQTQVVMAIIESSQRGVPVRVG
ncbi:MAG: Gfo/Idh/MocA family oxidoreductase [Caldilineaceae bacterium]|nr:Gfo/Idh/MocA family oxidoreductase [Caldilineaceae bacterium]